MKHIKTRSKYGYTHSELLELLKGYPGINEDKFWNALMGVTGRVDGADFITYFHDVELAVRCGLENRELYSWEWD